MILCLNCKTLSSRGARYCSYCKRSFSGRLCDKGHPSPMGAKCCSECGSSDLAKPTKAIRLSALSFLVACCAVLLLVKVLVANGAPIVGLAFGVFMWVVSLLFGSTFTDAVGSLLPILLILVWFGYCFARILGVDGQKYLSSIAGVARIALRSSAQIILWLGRVIRILVFGSSNKKAGGEK